MIQILYHVIQALINHPLLHIVRKRGDRAKRPPSFLQHTVDQTLLHSSWIAKIIRPCEDEGFGLNDPFVTHLTSVAAATLMFFLDSSDDQLASQATFGFNTCYAFVKKLSKQWPHLRNTIQKLDVLQTSRSQQPTMGGRSYTRSVQATLLWSLLDYSSSTTPTPIQETSSGTVELNAGTQFLSPLDSMQTQPMSCTPVNKSQSTRDGHTATDTNPDETMDANAFNESDIFGVDMFADFEANGVDAGFWTDFRL